MFLDYLTYFLKFWFILLLGFWAWYATPNGLLMVTTMFFFSLSATSYKFLKEMDEQRE